MSTQPVVAHKSGAEDFMPLHGIDHVELWVGNAAQAAHFYREALGFEQVAYAGLETGLRDRVSYVLQQGRIRIVLTGALGHGHEISEHHHRHGDGVKVIALSVPDTDYAYRTAVERGATGITEPHSATDDHGTVRLATIATYGETVHTFVERSGYTGKFLPGYVEQHRPPRHGSTGLLAIDHIVGNVELGQMERWVKFYATSNFAVAAARQGARAGYVSALGDDVYGAMLRAMWREEGVDDSGVRSDGDAFTAVYFVTHDAAGHHFSFFRRGSAASRLGAAQLPHAEIAAARVLHLSGISMAISETAREACFAAIASARTAGVKVSFDTNHRAKLWPLAGSRRRRSPRRSPHPTSACRASTISPS